MVRAVVSGVGPVGWICAVVGQNVCGGGVVALVDAVVVVEGSRVNMEEEYGKEEMTLPRRWTEYDDRSPELTVGRRGERREKERRKYLCNKLLGVPIV
ncbi:uncharacterized protein M6B38_269590 [Iris pallida]|uniref:Uncharacterized protein n=1 Tax=Iris pallida TaxID=29817 RepID=A0AAX6I8C6_IRIPA|nr:uncharacterized protein M6B38_105355 [Iris pallida]KAJ6849472.1 uncharacterized protein M6B38_269590 [Iris pallida]